MKKSAAKLAVFLCLLLLLCTPSLSLSGARKGLLLWANVLLPTLFPFMLCLGAVNALDGIRLVTAPFSPLFNGLMKLSPEGSFVFLSGLLCGYPVGAKTVSDFLADRRISLPEARLLLAISNHPSPMFLAGFILPRLHQAFKESPAGLNIAFFLAVYLPVLPVFLLAKACYCPDGGAFRTAGTSAVLPKPAFSFDDYLDGCLEAMVSIGVCVMVFSIISQYIGLLPLPDTLLAPLLGTLEITTGIEAISLRLSGNFCTLLIIASLCFGGISGIFQTNSVIKKNVPRHILAPGAVACDKIPLRASAHHQHDSAFYFAEDSEGISCEIKNAGLSIRHYILWKLLHSALSGLFFLLYLAL